MEDVLDLYERPYDPSFPVVCFDEKPYQMLDDIVAPKKAKSGRRHRVDSQYERKGSCSIMLAVEPLGGTRIVQGFEHRTKEDYARFLDTVAQHYMASKAGKGSSSTPPVKRIIVIQDNLNTHKAGAFYETFEPEKARALAELFEFHQVPVKGSWLNMAEVELSVLSRQCLGERRLGTLQCLRAELAAYEQRRNNERAIIQWSFTVPKARAKFDRQYKIVQRSS